MVIILAFMLTRLLNIILSPPVMDINGVNNDSRRDMIIGLTFMLISWRERHLETPVRIYLSVKRDRIARLVAPLDSHVFPQYRQQLDEVGLSKRERALPLQFHSPFKLSRRDIICCN